MKMSG